MIELGVLTVPADAGSLPAVVDMVTECAAPYFDDRKTVRLQLAAEEAVVNVFNACRAIENAKVRIRCMEEPEVFIIEIRDNGPPFNPVKHKAPDDESGPRIGGYGIPLIRKIMDEVVYTFENNENILKMISKK